MSDWTRNYFQHIFEEASVSVTKDVIVSNAPSGFDGASQQQKMAPQNPGSKERTELRLKTCGRLTYQKNFHQLVDAIRLLQDEITIFWIFLGAERTGFAAEKN